MKPTTKGQVEVQFNWIFVLIVGAIILGFFISIVVKQKQSSEQTISIDFFTSFEKALSGISAVEGKTQRFEIPNINLHYDCTVSCDCAAYAGTSRAKALIRPFSFNDKIIFSPNSLKGNALLVLSKDWEYPFRVTNFLYLTSPEVKYLVENSVRGQILLDDLPPLVIEEEQAQQRALDKQIFDPRNPSQIENIEGNYKVKFVFTDFNPIDFDIPTALESLPDSDVTAIKFVPAGVQEAQRVIFYQKKGASFEERGASYLLGDATEFAAVFAEDANAYSCMMNRAIKKLNFVSQVYRQKQLNYTSNMTVPLAQLEQLVDEHAKFLNNNCPVYYVTDPIDSIIADVKDIDFSKTGSDEQIIDLTKNIQRFKLQNDNALQSSCPQVY